MKFSDEVLSVIVLYKKRLQEAASFTSLSSGLTSAAQVAEVIVYDNSPAYNIATEIYDTPGWSITYIADEYNNGVSMAYNKAAEIAVKRKKNFLLLLDQDTNFPVETITEYQDAMRNYPNENIFVPIMLTARGQIISPCEFRMMRGFYARSATPGLNSLRGHSLINCGMCIRVSAFNKAGGYNNYIKLDFSDHEFVRRYCKRVSDSFVIINMIMHHSLSTAEKQTFKSDQVRFGYYLRGGKYLAETSAERLLIGFNGLLRGLKLSVVHRKAYFITSALVSLFSSK